jgi:hypothetical protein
VVICSYLLPPQRSWTDRHRSRSRSIDETAIRLWRGTTNHDPRSSVPLLDELMTPVALSERWGVSVGHLANLRSEGRGPTWLKIGGRIAYRVRDVAAYEEASVVSPDQVGTTRLHSVR